MTQNILIVDDSHTQLLILEKFLQQLPKVNILKARSGKEAFSLALENDFSLALIDIRMPDMDGVELADMLSSDDRTKHIAIIFLSAIYPDKLQLSRYNKSIAVDFFLKPINKELLLAKVQSILQLDLHSRNLEGLLAKRTKELDTVLLEWHMTIDAISDYISIIGVDHTILRANKSMLEKFGDNVVGKKCYEIFHCRNSPHPDCPALNLSKVQHVASSVIYENEEDIETYWDVSVFPIKNENGTVDKYVHIARDITEQRKIDKKLKEGEKMLAIGQLAGGIAHDFNNQLTAILGYATLLKNKIGDAPDLNRFVDTIIKSATSSAELTKQLLTFSKKDIQKKTNEDIHKLIKEAIVLADRPINKKVEIELQLNASKSVIYCDTSLILNAILNLILNANDAMPDGGSLTITTENHVLTEEEANRISDTIEPGEYIKIKFIDTGCGMSEEVSSKIFEPFFTTKQKKGTGLGLAAVYGTVGSHNGTIKVHSKEGKGTTFIIDLPIVFDNSLGESTQFDIQNARERNITSPLILLADDEESVRNYTQDILKALNYKVITVKDGTNAIEVYKKRHNDIDIVILDLIMPGMGGVETYNEMKEIDPELNVIFISGYNQDKIDVITSSPNTSLIHKPFEIKTLSDALKQYVSQRQQN